MSKFRVPEWCKNLLILALSLSALRLVSLSPLYVDSPLESWVDQLLSSEEAESESTLSLTAAARPLAVSLANADGRYTARYDADSVDAAFESVSALLDAALSDAGTPFLISETRWQSALSQPGVYLEFNCVIPFPVLGHWLNAADSGTLSSACARRLLLAPGNLNDEVWLFWQDGSSGLFYACSTVLTCSTHLEPAVEKWLPNASFFAFEDEAYAACAPYTLITDAPRPQVYTASVSLSAANSAAVEQMLSVFSYSPASGSSYDISGGTRYTDGVSTFQLTDSGVLTYHAPDTASLPVSTVHETPTLAECIEATRTLLQKTLGQSCGNAQLSLSSVEQTGTSLTLTYEYCLDGVPVVLRRDGWAAQFEIENGSVSQFTLHFRSYTPNGETTLVLPELQAAAALSALGAEGCELALCYPDSGAASVSADWLAR